LFLRKDLLRKVKQYDGKLANVLHTFHVRYPFIVGVRPITHRLQAQLGLDIRFALLAEGLKVRTLPISADDYWLTSSIGHS
jgi:hypothetical protein